MLADQGAQLLHPEGWPDWPRYCKRSLLVRVGSRCHRSRQGVRAQRAHRIGRGATPSVRNLRSHTRHGLPLAPSVAPVQPCYPQPL